MAEEQVQTPSTPATNSADIAGNAMRAMESETPGSSTDPSTPASSPQAPASSTQTTLVAPPPEQPEYTGLRDYAKSEMGIELPFQDDRSAFQSLVDGWRQSQQQQPYQPYIAEYLQHKQDFDKWRQSQQPVQKQEPLWNPPASEQEVTALMQHYYQRDADGTVKAKPDCPMDVRQKVEGYSRYIENFQQKLTRNPMEALQPFVQSMIAPLLQQQQQQMREDYAATQALSQHAQWLYEPNSGNQKLTPAGEIYRTFLVDGEKKGIRGVESLDDYALKMTHATLLSQQAQQKPAAASPAAAAVTPPTRNERFSQNNNRRPSVGSAVANGQAPAVDRKGMGLGEQMRSALKAANIDAGKEEAQELGLAN